MGSDQRSEFERDHDRVLYSLEFKRLGGVTQVASATEGHVFHNRLTHSLKVSQLARRLASWLARESDASNWDKADRPDAECAAAAALAHDLGHPPFGHVAEEALRELVTEAGDPNGFEGNAQSFRIVTRLAAHRPEYQGLDLMPRTLNAILKYPWARAAADPKRSKKFGFYDCDAAAMAHVRPDGSDRRSVEAQIMDIADDIAYAVHDLHDFWRAGLIPVDRLRDSDEAFEDFLTQWKVDDSATVLPETIAANAEKLRDRLRFYFPETFGGGFRAEALQHRTISVLIGELVRAVTLKGAPDDVRIDVDEANRLDLRFLQRLTWHFVIMNPRLSTQQAGQKKVVRALFDFFHEAAKSGDPAGLPARLAHLLEDSNDQPTLPARVAADAVAGLADSEAVALYRRIAGISMGSVFDAVRV